jgi:HD-like signal output (HDOD) protein
MDGLKLSIKQQITSLPPLPESVVQIERICRDPNTGINQLVTVVEQDPLLTANLLKTANSAYFGFASQVTSIGQAISLFGMSMVWGFAIESATRHCFDMNLKPYGLTVGQFGEISRTESALMWHWFVKLDQKMAEILIPSSFISRIGMVIIAAQLVEHGLCEKFHTDVKKSQTSLESVERKFIGNSNQEVCSAIFAQWNFDKTMVAAIRASESPELWNKEIQPYAYALKAVRTAVTNNGEITKQSAGSALEIAKKADLNQNALMTAFEKLLQ